MCQGKPFRCLLDTGSTKSLIAKSAVVTLQFGKRDTSPQVSELVAYRVSGAQLEFLVQVSLELQIASVTILNTLHVFETRSYCIILGQDFLQLLPITFTRKKFVFHFGNPLRVFST